MWLAVQIREGQYKLNELIVTSKSSPKHLSNLLLDFSWFCLHFHTLVKHYGSQFKGLGLRLNSMLALFKADDGLCILGHSPLLIS